MGMSYGLKMRKAAEMSFLDGLKTRKMSIFEWVQKNYHMGSKELLYGVKIVFHMGRKFCVWV